MMTQPTIVVVFFCDRKGDYEHAIVDFTRALQLNPDNVNVYTNRFITWLHIGNWENARRDLATVRNLGGNVINEFRSRAGSVSDFEQKNGVKLPEDITEMLTP